ncbi:MAG: hypothetical protein ABH834_08310 [Candidatus Altiarchaeota archaeon]
MKLPGFGKDKGKEEQEKIDAVIMSDYEDQDAVLKPSTGGGDDDSGDSPAPGKSAPEAVRKISMDVEKLKAQVEALMQMRSLNEERFQRTSEEVGDLRRRLIDKEKEISQLRIDSSKTTELVSAVQPQALMKELKKEDTKIEALAAHQEANRAITDSVVEETKNIKNTLSTFKGIETIINLNEEVKKELNSIKKVETVVEKHASKVESIFGSIQSRFNEFVKLSDKVSVMEASFKKSSKEFDQLKVRFEDYSKKEDFSSLRKELTGQAGEILDKLEGIDKLGKKFEEEARKAKKSGEKVFYEFETKTDNRLTEIEAYTKDLSDRIETMVMIEQDNVRSLQAHYKRLEDVFAKASEQSTIDESSRTLFRKVGEQFRENRLELTKNTGLIDSLGK